MDQASYAFARCHEAFIGVVRYNKIVIIEIIIIVIAVASIVVMVINVIEVIIVVVLVVVGHGRMGGRLFFWHAPCRSLYITPKAHYHRLLPW